jgi:hypothetical protein
MDQTDITDIGRRAAAPRRIALVAHDSDRGRRHPRGGDPPPNQQPAPELDDTTLSTWHQIIGHGDMTEKAKLGTTERFVDCRPNGRERPFEGVSPFSLVPNTR